MPKSSKARVNSGSTSELRTSTATSRNSAALLRNCNWPSISVIRAATHCASSSGVLVDEAGVRIVENLSVAMVFHHDHENMVEMWDALGHGAFLRHHATGESGQQAQS